MFEGWIMLAVGAGLVLLSGRYADFLMWFMRGVHLKESDPVIYRVLHGTARFVALVFGSGLLVGGAAKLLGAW